MTFYQNAVLTVIALALCAIAIQMAITPSFATGQFQKVIICDETGRCAKIDPSFEALTVKDPL